ncbi:MAG TPA: hypothetical protein VLX61_16765 [Anaerolineales bacterium]|nr:hypothetical protein [Anaerolineales bacterium]
MFRIPKKLLDLHAVESYLDDENISLKTQGNYRVLELSCNEDFELEFVDSGRVLGRLSTLREQIMQGDYRALYLTWLKSVMPENMESAEEIKEPPVPLGLNQLDAGLRALIDFFGIDPHLVAAAAGSSQQIGTVPEADPAVLISKLSREEMEAYLGDIVRGEPGALVSLKKHLTKLADNMPGQKPARQMRTLAELFQLRDRLKKQAHAKTQKEAERKRIQRLAQLSQRQEATWTKVESLCKEKRGKAYEEAVQLLHELYELGQYTHQESQFQQRFAAILDQFGKSVAFKDRLRRAGLI